MKEFSYITLGICNTPQELQWAVQDVIGDRTGKPDIEVEIKYQGPATYAMIDPGHQGKPDYIATISE